MGTFPLTARYDGRVLVPDAPLDAPPGTVFEIAPRNPTSPEALRPERPVATQEEWLAFLDSTAGTWIGPEMEDPDDPPPEDPDF